MSGRGALPAALLLAALLAAAPAHASLEQFGTFDPFAPEVDDESTIDYLLARPVEDWRDEWESSTSAMRSDQGCLTAGTWYQSNEFKARSPLAQNTWFDLGFLQRTDPAGSYEWLQFDVLHRTKGWGAFGGRFRPAADKSQQDFALLWSLGDGRSPFEANVELSIEDTFNRLWTFRQTAVGEKRLRPYKVHPFEPSIDLVSRGPHHRVELAETWLTPMRQDVIDPDPAQAGELTLQGNHTLVTAERELGAWTAAVRGEWLSARSTRRDLVQPGDGRVDRQRWSGELEVRRALTPRLRATARYLYQRRAQDWRPPVASATFGALDRVGEAALDWKVRDGWQIRTGLLYDRVGIASIGTPPGFFYGSRKESRAYIGLQARIGRVRVHVVEGIELDAEPYDVSFHHDKGFFHIQTPF